MKNKVRLRRFLAVTLAVTALCAVFLTGFAAWQYNRYTREFNASLASIIATVKEKYPAVSDEEIAAILNSENDSGASIMLKYGIDITGESVLLANRKKSFIFMGVSALSAVIFGGLLTVLFLNYERRRDQEIKEITASIEKINRHDYELEMNTISEDELSILKNEIYKTTVMLKEAAENAGQDRQSLKRAIEDISHQLKTPLTSIMIMLDDMIDDPQMPAEQQQEFLQDIKRETASISFLVQNMLKLSRFEANAITFSRREVELETIVDESIRNVAALCDLKDITVKKEISPAPAYCDAAWQTEAVTNILKNSIEHSSAGNTVEIRCSSNTVYSCIEIQDHGTGIADKDLPHIFERFYRSEKSAPDSVGIGLALAKMAVEQDEGSISVDTGKTGTVFRIRYYRQKA